MNDVTNTVYVANSGSDSVTVIDGKANEVVAGVTFHINPFGSGRILCDGLNTPSPTEQYTFVYSGDECKATPNEGFEFASWEENLAGNSTQLINVSRPISTWDSHDWAVVTFPQDNASLIAKFLRADELVAPQATLNITKFGTFTAIFRELPPAVPQEYQILFVSVFLTSVASLVIAWFGSRGKEKRREYDIP